MGQLDAGSAVLLVAFESSAGGSGQYADHGHPLHADAGRDQADAGAARYGCVEIFEDMREAQFLPANEAYRDNTRKELDHRVLIDMLGLPESVLEPLELLRLKWCSEPSVHGGKRTAPERSVRWNDECSKGIINRT